MEPITELTFETSDPNIPLMTVTVYPEAVTVAFTKADDTVHVLTYTQEPIVFQVYNRETGNWNIWTLALLLLPRMSILGQPPENPLT